MGSWECHLFFCIATMSCQHLREGIKAEHTYECSECGIIQCNHCPMPKGCNVCHQFCIKHKCNECLKKTSEIINLCGACFYPICEKHTIDVPELNNVFCWDGCVSEAIRRKIEPFLKIHRKYCKKEDSVYTHMYSLIHS